MAKLKLGQVVAVLAGKRTASDKGVTAVYHTFQKPQLFQGLSKRYSPNNEEGETFPDETQNIQQKVPDLLAQIRGHLAETLDLMATQDKTNCLAKANVVVDGVTILTDAPATHLLWLEKQLTDLHTNMAHIPVLDPQEKWTWDANAACYVSEPSESNKTKKVMRSHVLYEATDKHPAQCQSYTEDVVVGRWKTLKFSGAIPAQEKIALMARVAKLRDAVKVAREEVNASTEALSVAYAETMFDYILGKK